MANPTVILKCDPSGPAFPISEQCEMPKITVTAELKGVTPNPGVPLQYQWEVTLRFSGQSCPHAPNRVVKHSDITQITPVNKLLLPFTQVRGGNLTVSLNVTVAGVTLTAATKDLQVTGTNPSIAALAAATEDNTAFRKLMRAESSLRQFLSPTSPLFSNDGYGGVGLCQLTRPAPTDDQIWNWKENVKGGWELYRAKERVARAYPNKVRKSTAFQRMVNAYNAKRQAEHGSGQPGGGTPISSVVGDTPVAHLTDLIIELPEFTAEQLQRDTLRGFNGYAGIHEYRVRQDANGILVVTVDPSGTKGTAEWELVTREERIRFYDANKIASNRRGDPNYVDDVLSRASF